MAACVEKRRLSETRGREGRPSLQQRQNMHPKILTGHGSSRNAGTEERAGNAEFGFARAGKAKELDHTDHVLLLLWFLAIATFLASCAAARIILLAGAQRSLFFW